MALYVVIPNPRSPDEISALAIDELQARLPNWIPNAGALATIMIETNARESGELWVLASEVEDAIFRQFGPLVGITPVGATPATAQSTWVMVDNLGYTIPAGTQCGIRATGDELVAFETASQATVPPGATTTSPGEVQIRALVPGEAGSGLGGAGMNLELIDPLAFVDHAFLEDVTGGGVDSELDDDFLDRLATELRLMTPRPILPQDFAVLARRVEGVYRSLALDLYDPATDTWDNERMVTVAVVDQAGQPVSADTKADVDASLQEQREINFVVHVIDPTYTSIDVGVLFTVYPGYSPTDTASSVIAALSRYLSPASWGVPPDGDVHTWLNTTSVRYLELATVVNEVAGVDYITTLFFGASAHKDYSVAASSDLFTIPTHGYVDGSPLVVVASAGGAPLETGRVVYARNPITTNTFKVSDTPTGSTLDITTDGTGSVQLGGTADITLTGAAPLPRPGTIGARAG